MAGDANAGPLSELRAAWGDLTQSVSAAWEEAKNTVTFGDNKIQRHVLGRILWSASKLSRNAYEWELASERRRHSVQLRRLAVLMANLEALSLFVEGAEVTVSDGDILSVIDPGEGEDTPEQRTAPRADADEGEKLILANVYQRLNAVNRALPAVMAQYLDQDVYNIKREVEAILAYIRENN